MKITREKFNQLLSIEDYINKSHPTYKQFKKDLISRVKDVVTEDVWYSIKDKTRQALQYVLFLSAEKGFFYIKQDKVAKRYDISQRTIYRALDKLIECGLIVRVNRPSAKQNGKGSAVHIVTIHPNYETVKRVLNLFNDKANDNTGVKAEIAETPCVASDTSDSSGLTLTLPISTKTSKEVHNNVIDMTESRRFIKYVPKEINEHFADIYKDDLRALWVKINQAYTSIDQSILTKEDLYFHAKIILKRLFVLLKQKHLQNKGMSLDEQMAYVYVATKKSLNDALAEIALNSEHVIGDTAEEQYVMAKAEIQNFEREYDLKNNLKENFFGIKLNVYLQLLDKYKLLGDDLAEKLLETYHETSLMKDLLLSYNKKIMSTKGSYGLKHGIA